MNYKVGIRRGANAVMAMPESMGSPQDKRWATGRNVKRSLPGRRYDVVQVWTLKERMEDGTVRVAATHRSREAAAEWVNTKAEEK